MSARANAPTNAPPRVAKGKTPAARTNGAQTRITRFVRLFAFNEENESWLTLTTGC